MRQFSPKHITKQLQEVDIQGDLRKFFRRPDFC